MNMQSIAIGIQITLKIQNVIMLINVQSFQEPQIVMHYVEQNQIKGKADAQDGCIESGIKCEDQISELGCVTKKDRSQACCWTSGKCYHKIYDNAITSQKQCKNFLPSCTTKQGGGCITRTTCGAAVISAACVKDSIGADCFWNGTTYLLKTCANALNTNTTNVSCQSYLPKCITTGAGCVDNTGCEAAKIKDACDKTLSGTQCHWDGTYCKVKTCLNAGSNYKGHDECTTYMDTCTANGASGCTDRSCTNAPISNNTNDLCKLYYPSGNCVTKKWDGTCKTKTYANSPPSNNTNTHDLCQQFFQHVLGQSSIFVDKIFENIQAEEDCTTDINNKIYIYKGKSYSKQCILALKSIITHSNCQYLSTFTLHNSIGFGCMPIPIKYETITQKTTSIIKSNGGKCGLQGKLCLDQACNSTPTDESQLITTNTCNFYRTECVVNNNLNGYMDLPQNCAGRKQSENCEIELFLYSIHKCSYCFIQEQCFRDGLLGLFQYEMCNQCCKQCMYFRPKSCTGLQENACKQADFLVGDINCYWDLESSSRNNAACQNITFLLVRPQIMMLVTQL